jgi:hypothetical protein
MIPSTLTGVLDASSFFKPAGIMEQAIVFPDGQYLNIIRQHFVCERKIKIDKFAVNLAKHQNLWCERAYYYTAPPYQSPAPTTEETSRRAGYDKFVNAVKRIPNFTVREGRCQKTDDGFKAKRTHSWHVQQDTPSRKMGTRDRTDLIVGINQY